ncbi:hypothetical protein [Falsiroseomonas sp. HW251]|uniref:hypothetical protein n=1 Tax=Falsiroseomonas sp. HW251 TaxID=3390998 RepID=UPI003D3228E5
MTYLLARLREQGTHSGVALLAAIILLAHIAGVDLQNLADSVVGVATALGALAAAAKAVLPDGPKEPPR